MEANKSGGSSRGGELIKNTAIVTVGKVCTRMLSFFLLPVYTAILSQEEYGATDLIFSYVTLLTTAFFLQIEDALFRYLIDLRGEEDGTQRVISTAFGFVLLQSAAVVLVYYIVQHWIASPYKLYLLLNILTSALAGMALQITRGLGDNTGYAAASFLMALATILSNILTILVLRIGARGILLSACVGHLLGTAYIFIHMRLHRYIRPGRVSRQTLRDMVRYSFPLVPNALSWWVIGVSDKTIVSYFLGVAANGILAVSQKFSNIFTMVYGIFGLTWTESASLYKDAPDRDEYFSYIIDNAFRLLASACLGIIAAVPLVFRLLINEQYGESYGLIPLYMISALIYSLIGIYSVVYIAFKQTKQVAKTSMLAAIINLAGNFLLIGRIGMYAAPVSSILAYGGMFVYRIFDVKRYMTIRVRAGTVVSMAVFLALDCLIYYCTDSPLVRIINLLVIAGYAAFLNRGLLKTGIQALRAKLSARKKGGREAT